MAVPRVGLTSGLGVAAFIFADGAVPLRCRRSAERVVGRSPPSTDLRRPWTEPARPAVHRAPSRGARLGDVPFAPQRSGDQHVLDRAKLAAGRLEHLRQLRPPADPLVEEPRLCVKSRFQVLCQRTEGLAVSLAALVPLSSRACLPVFSSNRTHRSKGLDTRSKVACRRWVGRGVESNPA